ncbi:MAG: DUF4339 domain-containing protein [Flavobacteriales bacterium]|nr:DUF4339 domain-containing protein [Flavobacteriales bacterium]MCC6937768.1 DUF4339 domain-containing protein [Flavobacteriales bacterium]
MAIYFIHNGNDKEGPFDKDALRAKIIKANTQVWCEGMADWVDAGSVEELKDLFTEPPPIRTASKAPPPIREESATVTPSETSKRGMSLIAKVTLGVIAIVGGLLAWNYFFTVPPSRGSSYEEKVMTIEEIERADPVRFLDASGKWNENFWGNKLRVHGRVTSSATVASYKDVVIQVSYYSETKTVLGTEQYVLYKFVPPNQTIEFEWTLNRPDACKKLGWDVVSATPVY